MSDEKKKRIDAFIGQVEKAYGKGAVMKLDPKQQRERIEAVKITSTGSLALDRATKIGGYPSGRIIEIYGPESGGKTTLALQAIAQVQRAGGVGFFIDAEHALDLQYAGKLGVDTDELLFSQPDNGEQALEIVDMAIKSDAVNVVVIDSVSALVPKAEIDGNMGDSHMGLQARLMSQALRKITGLAQKHDVMVIFINQIRMKIGIMFGNPETTSGGNALKFYASMRIDVRPMSQIKDGEVSIGNRVKMKVVKNKLAPPHAVAEADLIYGDGINRERELIDLAVELKIIDKSGSWFAYGKMKLGQGKDAVAKLLADNYELAEELEKEIRKTFNA